MRIPRQTIVLTYTCVIVMRGNNFIHPLNIFEWVYFVIFYVKFNKLIIDLYALENTLYFHIRCGI